MPKPVKPRPAPLSIRLNDSERAALRARASGVGLSTYAKSVLFAESGKTASADQALFAQVLGQLGASGLPASMATLAAAAETGSLFVDQNTAAALRAACTDIAGMRGALMQALGWSTTALDAPSLRAAFREAAE